MAHCWRGRTKTVFTQWPWKRRLYFSSDVGRPKDTKDKNDKSLSTTYDDGLPPDYDDDDMIAPVPEPKRPFRRALKYLKKDIINMSKGRFVIPESEYFPSFCDVVIVGGGILGSAIAFWLKHRVSKGLKVVVVEKDLNCTRSSTAISIGGLQQQFSVPENIQMAMFGAEFMRDIKKYLTVVEMDPPDINFTPCGHLFLARESEAETLRGSFKIQKELGARVELLTAKKIKQRFPWMDTSDIELGCCGYTNEGWFDPNLLLQGYQLKALSLDAIYIHAEAIGFTFEKIPTIKIFDDGERVYERLRQLVVKAENGKSRTITAAYIILAAGSDSSEIGKLARIGTHPGILRQPIPVEARKRCTYTFSCPEGPGIECPYIVDHNGMYFRREGLGGHYVCGKASSLEEKPDNTLLDVDYSLFENELFPLLCHRIPSFKTMKLTSAQSGIYDCNTYDQMGIVGSHPYYPNLILATGFNSLGVQQSPAIGRAVTELLIDGEYKTIDLSRFSFERLLLNEPIHERNVL